MREPTPGQLAYETFWQAFAAAFGEDIDSCWDTIHPGTQRAWDAAAQAVLALKEEEHGCISAPTAGHRV